MHKFIKIHRDRLLGTLSGFDRLRFRGTLLLLTSEGGMSEFLWRNQILLKDFQGYVLRVTDRLRGASERIAAASPPGKVLYLPSPHISKEDTIRRLIERHRLREGLLAVLSCREPCRSFDVRRNRETKRLELHYSERQCLHQYFYFLHRQLGLLYVRLQTWFPFTLYVGLNGREWLARQMDAAGMAYLRRDNCFTHIDDVPRAQRLMDRQLRCHWPRLLNRLRRAVHPTHRTIVGRCPMDYYWTVSESEWATDVMFRSPTELARLYPRLVRHGLLTFGSSDVMRFLGRKEPAHGGVNGHFQGEVVSDLGRRPEGLRLKHRVNQNSLKMYDKQGSVLRIETTLINPKDFKVYRPKQDDPEGPQAWLTLRKGVADLHRRAEVCQAANERYLNALAAVDENETTVAQLGATVCRRIIRDGRQFRALNPLAEDDAKLLEIVHRGEFAVNGLRNRDVRDLWLGAQPRTPAESRRTSTQVTRKLALLRAHGLIQRVPKTHRYVLTAAGQKTIAALLAVRQTTTKQLTLAA